MQAFYVISLLLMLASMCAAQSAIIDEFLLANSNHPQNIRSLTGDSTISTSGDDLATAEQRGFGFRRGFRRGFRQLRHFGRRGFFG